MAFLARKPILGPPPAPPIEVFDLNQSFQGRVYALDIGLKHLVGFEYVGWGLLHSPQNGSLAKKKTVFALGRSLLT